MYLRPFQKIKIKKSPGGSQRSLKSLSPEILLLEWPQFKTLTTPNADKDVEQQELLFIADSRWILPSMQPLTWFRVEMRYLNGFTCAPINLGCRLNTGQGACGRQRTYELMHY